MTREIVASKKQDWGTPRWLFAELHAESNFTIDLCAADYNACLPRRFGPGSELGEDGLVASWANERGFGNPPYEDVGSWLHKALVACAENAFSQWLIPANTDTKWFHQYAYLGQVDLFQGRLSFEDLTPPAIELERVYTLYRVKGGKNLLKKTAVLFREIAGDDVWSHENRMRAMGRALGGKHNIPAYIEGSSEALKNFTGWEGLKDRKNGPGFPSMLVTFDPTAPPGPHPFRRRSAKTGELL